MGVKGAKLRGEVGRWSMAQALVHTMEIYLGWLEWG